MAKMKLKPCPFCGARIKNEWPNVANFDQGKWEVSHHCPTENLHGLGVCIQAYGSTRKQAIERWNTRAGEG